MNKRQLYNLQFLIDGIEECNEYTPAQLYTIAKSLLNIANDGGLDHTHCSSINQAFVWSETDDGSVFWHGVHGLVHKKWKKLGIKEKYNIGYLFDGDHELGQLMMEDLDGVASFDKNFEDDMVIGMELI